MHVIFVASECAPIVKVGGLADVVGGLPKALSKSGIDVTIIIPRYSMIDVSRYKSIKVLRGKVEYDGKNEDFTVEKMYLPNTKIPVYLIGNEKYIGRDGIYEGGKDYTVVDRFSFFSKAVVEFIKINNTLGTMSQVPSSPPSPWLRRASKFQVVSSKFQVVIHCHDWHTAWIPRLINENGFTAKTVLTIHNMGRAYQGLTDKKTEVKMGLSTSATGNGVNILKNGIEFADAVTTVSPAYAKEIQTKEAGEGLESLLKKYKNKVKGILNGIDNGVWDPETDKNLAGNYSIVKLLNGKTVNKKKLLGQTGLKYEDGVPLFGMVSRIAGQKGFDILIQALKNVLSRHDIRVIILATGDPRLEAELDRVQTKFKDKIIVIKRFDEVLSHLIYAGSDFFLVPSKYEPCGLTQMIAMRYGSIPVVRKTGGLSDSVIDGKTGLVFKEYSGKALAGKIEEAVKCYKNYNGYNNYNYYKMADLAMKQDFSWSKSAEEYVDLYKRLLKQ